jgi:hypothetical protein
VTKNPGVSTDYKFTTEGEVKVGDNFCGGSDTVTVHVITKGEKENLSALNISGGLLWEADIPPEIIDPKIMVTSIRSVACPFGNGTYSGVIWIYKKTDLNGHIRTGFVSPESTSPDTGSWVGKWEFEPVTRLSGTKGDQQCFEITVTCS